MKALSFKQPWAWLVAAGIKDVENRTWRLFLPPLMIHPAAPRRIYVHASLRPDRNYPTDDRLHDYTQEFCEYAEQTIPKPFGAIIGEVDIVACFGVDDIGYPAHKSPWFIGPYGFVLNNAVLYDKPFPFKGKLGFFEVELPDAKTEVRT
jgi:hypothetical protein